MLGSGIPRSLAHRGLCGLAMVSVGSLGSLCIPSTAAAAPQVQADALTYVVQADDYLSGIAATLGVSLNELLQANNLTVTSAVYPGTKLIIPGNTPLPTYTVKAGDFLNGIAKAAGMRLRDLLALNGLQKESLVLAGDVLRLPRGTKVATTPTAPPPAPAPVPAPGKAPAPAPVPAPSVPAAAPTSYTVKNGDWLIGIAMAHSIKVRDLIAVNGMQLDSLVYEGLVLKLPANAKAPAAAPVKQPSTPTPTPAPATTPAPAPAPPKQPAPAPAPTPTPTPAASENARKIVDFAMAQIGKPYKFFSAGPDSFDCSGLSKAAYAQIGIELTHFSGAQATAGVPVDWTTQPILPGDLVFTASSSTPGVIGHLGIAIDGKRWVHAPRAGDVVRTGNIPSASKILAVRRLIPAG